MNDGKDNLQQEQTSANCSMYVGLMAENTTRLTTNLNTINHQSIRIITRYSNNAGSIPVLKKRTDLNIVIHLDLALFLSICLARPLI